VKRPNELSEFLRARRAGVRPADVGLPEGTGLRRTPGLRREEIAALAGISIEYYIRLEQGKETNPSAPVLRALSSALMLDREARAHLYALANRMADRTPSPRPARRRASAGVLRIMHAVRPFPAFALTRANDILAANPEALALFTGLADWPVHLRNSTRYTFTHPAARELFADWHAAASSHVANLRAQLVADPDIPGLAALVAELSDASPEFAELWQRYDVGRHRGAPKRFRHPEVGDLTLMSEALSMDDDGQRLTIYHAEPGTPDHDALALLSAATSLGGSRTS
jgi:transcriptional regulator with XRE-family HTH domain